MYVHVLLLVLLSGVTLVHCDYEITVFPEILKIGDRTYFDRDRWISKNGLDWPQTLPIIKQLGTVGSRWVNRDLRDGLFEKATEDPHRKGYPDPNYFLSRADRIALNFNYNMQNNPNMEVVMDMEGMAWPHWIDTSKHSGRFPNNIDAASEFVSLMIQAVHKGSKGKLPLFFEGVNEPDWFLKSVNWSSVITFYQSVAQKIKSKYPQMKVGGPTLTNGALFYDQKNFAQWKNTQQFLDMALTHLDFFSFHSYASIDVRGGTHQFYSTSEAKVSGLLDLIETYAHKKTGKSFDVIVSEYSLAGVTGMNEDQASTFLDWAQIYQCNAHLFTFLERRDVMRKAIPYLMTYYIGQGLHGIHLSLLDQNNHVTNTAQAVTFWKDFDKSKAFLRVDSQFHGAVREIVPHALVDKSTGTLTILLHNHGTQWTHAKLNFDKGWFHPSTGKSTCEYLGGRKNPVLEAGKAIQVTNSLVTLPPESTCSFQFHTTHNFANAPTVTQSTYYSNSMIIAINSLIDVQVNLPTLGNIEFARLRISVSFSDKKANPKPKTVQMNSHTLTSFYSLKSYVTYRDATMFESYEYNVPTNALRQHNNDIKLTFNQKGGYVSTVALTIGRR